MASAARLTGYPDLAWMAGQVALVQDLGFQLADQVTDPGPGQLGPVRHRGDQPEPVPGQRGRPQAEPFDHNDVGVVIERRPGRDDLLQDDVEAALAQLPLQLGGAERFRRARHGPWPEYV